MSEKLQKVLSRLGIGSRRGIEKMIADGRVSCNGVVAKIGDRVEADKINVQIDGKVVLMPSTQKPQCRVLMYHKPEGELTTLNDPEDRPTVFDHLPKPDFGRWIYVGRLDINTSGLLLFTTDGDLANALMHPRHGIERIYASRIYGEVSEQMLEQLQNGVILEDGKAHFDKVTYVGGEARNAWYHVSLKEGRKREVRRLWEAVGVKVSRLIRISYGGIELDPALKSGQYRELTLREINKLRRLADMEPLSLEDMPKEPLANITEAPYKARAVKSTAVKRNSEKTHNERPRVPGSLGNAKYVSSRRAVLEDKDEDKRNFERRPSSKKGTYGGKPSARKSSYGGKNSFADENRSFSKKTKAEGYAKTSRSSYRSERSFDDFDSSKNDRRRAPAKRSSTRWEKGPAFLDKEQKRSGPKRQNHFTNDFKGNDFADKKAGRRHFNKSANPRRFKQYDR
ncbi:MAG: 23S rRNA pseudouridine(2605) synthase RluB [Succinatimonas sp.]|nr:23S rRNA pseudouridine(2605) synthase RluB [Succinatimonas sp.]